MTTSGRLSYLTHLPQRVTAEVVHMDMWGLHGEAARAALPQARIAVDTFHVVRMANQALETVRKTLREGLKDKQQSRATTPRTCAMALRES